MSTVTGGTSPHPQSPIIGSKVRYQDKAAPRVAVVTVVESPTLVSLCVFLPDATQFVHSVKEGTEPGQWSWPPT